MKRLIGIISLVLIFAVAQAQDPSSLVTHGWLAKWARNQVEADSITKHWADSIVSARAIGPTGTPAENYVPKWSEAAAGAVWRPDSTGAGGGISAETAAGMIMDTAAARANDYVPIERAPVLRVDIATPVLAALVWTNMPAAVSFWLSTATVAKGVTKADLTNYTQVRLLVNKQGTSGAAASKLILRYKVAPFTQTVANYSDIGTSEVSVATNVNNTFLETAWINLAASAKADVFIALVGSGGDGALDPAFGQIVAEFK